MLFPSLLALFGKMSTWQKLDPGAPDQLVVANRLGSAGRVVIQMPVRPCPLLVLVVHKLEQILWHTYLPRTDAWALGNAWSKHRAGDDVHVACSARSIFSSRHLNRLCPCATVMFWGLWTPWRLGGHHIYQRKALCHGLHGRHVSCRGQVATNKTTSFVII